LPGERVQSPVSGAQNWRSAKEVHIVPRVIGISAIVGFFLSLVFLVAVSFYAVSLRSALVSCRQTHVTSSNQVIHCENRIGVLNADKKELVSQIEREQGNIRALESRLEAAGSLRRCAAVSTWETSRS
jgi:hypothetical protein